MSHDPLLDRFRSVRSLLTSFKNTLTSQKRFTVETASIFSSEDKALWALQQDHERLKHGGLSPANRNLLMELLGRESDRWTRLCRIAESGEPITAEIFLRPE